MKKIYINTLTILVVILSFSTMTQADDNIFKNSHHSQKKSHKEISFIPHDDFGGIKSQGTYTRKGKTATINYGNITYSFDMIKKDANPWLKNNKLDLVKVGSFSNKVNRFGMPSITYLFGAPTNEITKNAIKFSKKHPQVLLDKELLDNKFQGITFKPSKEYSANFFSTKFFTGSYFNNNHTAIIQDTSNTSVPIYTFENVVEGLPASMTSDTVRPMYKPVLIGSYKSKLQCSNGTPKVCTHKAKVIQLYGNIKVTK